MPLVTDSETICALATAQGVGAISVIRISGAQAVKITSRLAPFLPDKLESHKVYYGHLRTLDSNEPIDEVLISFFREGRSFTGEDTCEISCHGSESIVSEILQNLILAGARSAKRGEFTYRAYMHGRLDLVQAESVLDLIESRSPRASKMALRQLSGAFSRKFEGLLNDLTWVLAQLEANIDFATEDIVIASNDTLAERIKKALSETESLLQGYTQGRIIREGFQVALVGAPNVGKSSLLNAIAGEERAIVTPIAGTTRDFVEAQTMIAGFRITFIDTAGLRETRDEVEKIGVARTIEKINEADLVLYVVDTQAQVSQDQLSDLPHEKTVIVVNKIDLSEVPKEWFGGLTVLPVSALRGTGLSEMKEWLARRIGQELSEDSTPLNNARHYEGLLNLKSGLEAALPLIIAGESPDLVAVELQAGLRSLHEILGRVFDDQVMDRVFSEFCLGK